MNKSFFRMGLTMLTIAVAFVLFMNRGTNSSSFRDNILAMNQVSIETTIEFVNAYKDMNQQQTYEIKILDDLTDTMSRQRIAYKVVADLPEKAINDHMSLLSALDYQIFAQEALIAYCRDGQSIPQELILDLKSSIEKRELYEARLARF